MEKINVNDSDNVNDKKKGEFEYEYDYEYMFKTREGQLARYLAEGLNDTKSIRYYFSVSLDYSERYLKEIYRKTKETPDHKIKKSRGALFAYLVKKYEKLDTLD
jgi:hypothetical protein